MHRCLNFELDYSNGFQGAKSFLEWLLEIEAKAEAEKDTICNEISERRSLLEKYKTLKRELEGRADVFAKIKAMKEEDESRGPVDADIQACVDKHEEIAELISRQIEVRTATCDHSMLRSHMSIFL